jgi:hypothetical protein
MAKLLPGDRIVPVWVDALNYLEGNGREGRNLVLEIADPTRITAADRDVIAVVDAALRVRSQDARQPDLSINTVAATIFPQSMYRRHGRPALYDAFVEKMAKAQKDNTWGTYALRIMRRQAKDPTQWVTPIEQVIDKLTRATTGGHPYQAVYELGVVEPSEDLDPADAFGWEVPTFDVKLDGKLVRNMPCLSHLSFKLTNRDQVDLTAIYRYHYYCQRGLGNLIGLSQLLQFVANESNLKVGSLTCISTQAALDLESWRKSVPAAKQVLEAVKAAAVP